MNVHNVIDTQGNVISDPLIDQDCYRVSQIVIGLLQTDGCIRRKNPADDIYSPHGGSQGATGSILLPPNKIHYKDVDRVLYAAVINGQTAVVKDLLSQVGQIAQNFLVEALKLAAKHGHLDMMQLLHQQVIHMSEKNLATYMNAAATNGHLQVIQYLLPQGRLESQVYLAAIVKSAASNGHVRVIEYLFSQDWDSQLSEQNLVDAVYCAAEQGHTEVIEYLLLRIRFRIEEYLHCIVTTAAEKGHVEVIRVLLSGDRRLGEQGLANLVKVYAARGHVGVIQALLPHGNWLIGQDLACAVHAAAEKGHVEVIAYLLSQEGMLGEQDLAYAVHAAAEKGHVEVIRVLLPESGSHSISTATRSRIIVVASSNGHLACVEYLLRNGPIGETARNTAISQASGNQQLAIRDMLRMAQVDMGVGFHHQLLQNSMTIQIESIGQDPEGFLKTLCAKESLPNRFILAPTLVGNRTPIDLGGVSKQVYSSLFAELYRNHFFSLTEAGFPYVEQETNLNKFRQLGKFYAMFVKRNQGRSDPFLTGRVFSPDFFHFLRRVADTQIDLHNLSGDVLAELAQHLPADPFEPALKFLQNPSLEGAREVISLITLLGLDPQSELQKVQESDQHSSESMQERAVSFSQYIVKSYLNPALALLDSEEFRNTVRSIPSATLCDQLQGQSASNEAVLDILETSGDSSAEFQLQVDWIKEILRKADEPWLQRFLLAITGRPVLASGVKIKLQVLQGREQEERKNIMFKIHTCVNSLDLSPEILDRDLFLIGLHNLIMAQDYNTV